MIGSAAEMEATDSISWSVLMGLAIFLSSLTTRLVASSISDLMSIGLAPAAIFLKASFTKAWAMIVEVVVPSPAISLVFMAAPLRRRTPMSSWTLGRLMAR